MKRGRFAPDGFPVALALLGVVLLVFPSLRVEGMLAVLLAVTYWLSIAVVRLARR